MDETISNYDQIKNVDVEEEMKISYLRYAMSVIVSRALPDVRDGLKPSQRRILVSLNDLNLRPNAKYRKCAKIVGDTNGNYHPHGDAAVYQTLVRLAQDFSIRYPLIDGQGNFGSVDGDPPAAMRYTEAKMDHPSQDMLTDIQMDTVDYIANYDETRTEPTVLPAKFPNLICNGGSGIAVGVATNMAPHNLVEVCNALNYLLDNPDCSVEDLMVYITAPDFPSGGIICGREGIIESYKVGRGRVIVRGRHHIEDANQGKQRLVFTEIPYQVNKTTLIDKIVDGVKDGKIQGISDVTDESDKDGMRLIIELKKGEDPELVLNQLWKHTQLQDNFSLNCIALVDGKPRRLTLKDFLVEYKNHRFEVISRRTKFLLNKAEARAHILEGLRIAIDNIDAIIEIIRNAPDVETAKTSLMERFGLSEIQSQAILDMQLRRLTGLERDKIEEEYRELLTKIAEYKEILANSSRVHDLIREDLEELKAKYGEARRSEIGSAVGDMNNEDLIHDDEMAVMLSHGGYIKRLPTSEFRTQGRGGKGVVGMNTRDDDFTENLVIANNKDYLLLFTDYGKVYWKKVYEVPQSSRTGKGRSIANLLNMENDEKILTAIPVREFDERHLMFATANGVVKKTALSAYSNPKRMGIKAIVLDEGDTLIDVKFTTGKEDIILSTAQGMSIRFVEKECRPMGRVSRGVRGIDLRGEDKVVSMNVVDAEGEILTICAKGYGKKSDFSAFRTTHRGGKGVKTIANIIRNGVIIRSLTVTDQDEVLLLTKHSKVLRFAVAKLRTLGRNTSGVRLIRLEDDDTVESVVPLAIADEAEDIQSTAVEDLQVVDEAEDINAEEGQETDEPAVEDPSED